MRADFRSVRNQCENEEDRYRIESTRLVRPKKPGHAQPTCTSTDWLRTQTTNVHHSYAQGGQRLHPSHGSHSHTCAQHTVYISMQTLHACTQGVAAAQSRGSPLPQGLAQPAAERVMSPREDMPCHRCWCRGAGAGAAGRGEPPTLSQADTGTWVGVVGTEASAGVLEIGQSCPAAAKSGTACCDCCPGWP